MDTLFRSVIPGPTRNPRPISGRGNPNGLRGGQTMQIYTEESGKAWCKSQNADATLGWFELGTARGHPLTLVGNYFETNPNGLYTYGGPAVWFGWDQSIWVKTVSTVDNQGWVFLAFSSTIGLPDYYSFSSLTNDSLVSP